MPSDNIVTRLIKSNQGDGVSMQTKRELMRLGLIPGPTDKQKTDKPEGAQYTETGRTQEQEFARVLGEAALQRRMAAQAAQKQMLLRKMQQSQQHLQLQQAVNGEEEPADDEVVKAIQSAVQNMQQRRK